MADLALQEELKRLRGLVDLLNGTLVDSERVLFDAVVAAAVKHYGMVRKDQAFACTEILDNLAKLKKARPKRIATLASKRAGAVESKSVLSEDEVRFLTAIARRNPGEALGERESYDSVGDPMWQRLEAMGLIKHVGCSRWQLTDKARQQIVFQCGG